MSEHHGHNHPKNKREVAALSLGALGVVYGDIGTSPLYAMKECLSPASAHALPLTEANVATNVYGVVSLMFWALTLVIVLKYLVFVLRADNKGEGGILALAALVSKAEGKKLGRIAIPVLLALFGAGLLFGEGALTPAISVLSAVEGLTEKSPSLSYLVLPITITILVGLFLVQRFGTHRIGRVFGWITLVWFLSIAAVAIPHIAAHPQIFQAINPVHGFHFFLENGVRGFLLLGSVVLVITGGEALYADMGHFGRNPIRIAWFAVVFPCLMINYFGQGALILSSPPGSITHPFYDLVSGPMLIPMLVLATCATIIASQALISGAFSITQQAVQLGFVPRVTIIHTSDKHEGQIYVPEINYLLMVMCLAVVLMFKTSTNLAAAYGIAVTGTMTITTILFSLVCVRVWNVPVAKVLLFTIPFLIIDLSFFSANAVKIVAGGWLPLAIGAVLFLIMTTWWHGRAALNRVMADASIPDALFLADLANTPIHRVSGTAVFMASSLDGIPNVMLHHVKHNKVLHKQVILLSVTTANLPWVQGNHALEIRELGHGFSRIVAKVGFMQQANVPRMLVRAKAKGLDLDLADLTYYLGRQKLVITGRLGLARWRKTLFAFLARNARPPTDHFQLPPNRVVELGLQVEI